MSVELIPKPKFTELNTLASYTFGRYQPVAFMKIEKPANWTDEQWSEYLEEIEEEFNEDNRS